MANKQQNLDKVQAKFGAKIDTNHQTFFDKTILETLKLIRYLGLLQRKNGLQIDENWILFAYALCAYFWIWTFRVAILYLIPIDKTTAVWLLDIGYFFSETDRKVYLTVEGVFGLLAALISTHFIYSLRTCSWIEEIEESWYETDDILYPQTETESKFKAIKIYVFRLIGVFFLVQLAIVGINYERVKQENAVWELVLSYLLFKQLSLSVILLSALFFIHICFFLNDRFVSVTDDLNESLKQFNKLSLDPSADKLKDKDLLYAEKITLVQRRHLKICEMLQQTNDFWNLWLFFLICILLPFAFFTTYEAIFGNSMLHVRLTIGWFGCSAWIVIGMITLYSARVSGNAHRPLEVLFNITLNTNLPFDLKVKLKDFIQRLNGPTIGLECLSFFVVTQSQIYSVSMALISYFLIFMSMGERHKFDKMCTLQNGTVINHVQFTSLLNYTLHQSN